MSPKRKVNRSKCFFVKRIRYIVYNLLMKSRKNLFLLFFVLVLAAFLRFYKIENLAIFLSDQASDSTKVFEMMRGRFTLLGPITSVGGFYNGPIVYYLMLPFYWILKGGPVSGTVFQTVLQIATIPFIFLLGKKLKNETVGLIASFLFAISPLMIDYSRAGFNAHPAIFFSTLILYVLFLLKENFSLLKGVLLGIFIGFILQMHYMTISILLFVFLYPLIFQKKLFNFRYYLTIITGIIIGLSPFLLFELRHQFLNINLFLKYFFSEKTSSWSFIPAFKIWPETINELLFGNYFIAIAIVVYILKTFFYIKNKETKPYLLFFLCIFLISLIYGKPLQKHYIIAFHTSLILLFSLAVESTLSFWQSRLSRERPESLLVFVLCFLIFFINLPRLNLEKSRHPLQRGMAVADFRKAAKIINEDNKEVYNVAMHTQGDNRAMPLRYMLLLLNEKPLDYEHYGEAEELYFLIPKTEKIEIQTMWEYTSFGSSNVVNKWEINEEYFLYKLDKLI